MPPDSRPSRRARAIASTAVSAFLVGAAALAPAPARAAKAKPAKAEAPIVVSEVPPKPLGNPSAPQGGTFYFQIEGEPPTLNPITSTDLYAMWIHAFTFDNLLLMNPDTHGWMPGLAERAEVSPDGKIYTFALRSGALWSDGKPVTAEDVKFSFDAIFDDVYNAAHRRPYLENFEKCEVVDERTVRFVTKEKYFGSLESLNSNTLYIIPKHVYGDPKEGMKKNKTLVGSGPYVIEKYDQGQRLTLVRNKNWWGSSVGFLKGWNNFERIVVRFVKDETVALEMLKKGDLDFMRRLTPEAFMKKAVGPEWGKTVLKIKTENKDPKEYGYVGWNAKNPLFKERDVRIALQMLMNRPEMIKKFRYDLSLPATGPWYQQSEYADPARKPIPFDPKKAAQLLAKAGWKDSDNDGVLDKAVDGQRRSFSFELVHGNKDAEKYLTMYQEDLRKAGIKMAIKLLEWNALLKIVHERKFEAAALAWGAGSVDIDPKQVWHSASGGEGGSNYVGYSNPEVDKLIDQARSELDKAKRVKLLRKVYGLIADDAPYAFMFNNKYVLYGRTARIGVAKDSFVYDIGYGSWWLQKPQ